MQKVVHFNDVYFIFLDLCCLVSRPTERESKYTFGGSVWYVSFVSVCVCVVYARCVLCVCGMCFVCVCVCVTCVLCVCYVWELCVCLLDVRLCVRCATVCVRLCVQEMCACVWDVLVCVRDVRPCVRCASVCEMCCIMHVCASASVCLSACACALPSWSPPGGHSSWGRTGWGAGSCRRRLRPSHPTSLQGGGARSAFNTDVVNKTYICVSWMQWWQTKMSICKIKLFFLHVPLDRWFFMPLINQTEPP